MRVPVARAALVALIEAYQAWIAPYLPARCRYWPTCSEYARLAIRHRGVVLGGAMAAGRLLRCQPLGAGGIDPPR